ncbi:hypothetical protein QTN25_007430 [Entamoeba marina]
MATSDCTFKVKCDGQQKPSESIDLYSTPLNFLSIYTSANTDINLEITIVTQTLASVNEMGTFQCFIPQKRNLLSTILSDLGRINYPRDDQPTPQNDVKVIVQKIYNYLYYFQPNGTIYLVSIYFQDSERFKKLFNDAGFEMPNQIKIIEVNDLVNSALKSFGKKKIKGQIFEISRKNINIPQQKKCPYHSVNASGLCITNILKKYCYTVHAILKQSGLSVEGDYVPIAYKQKDNGHHGARKPKKENHSTTSNPINNTLIPIIKTPSPINNPLSPRKPKKR